MHYERSKAPLALMEQIVMVLVFALAAAVCLQAFVYSDNLSKEGELRDLAVTRSGQVAEHVKAAYGDFDRAGQSLAERYSGDFPEGEKPRIQREDGRFLVSYPDGMTAAMTVEASNEYMEKAVIRITGSDGKELYAIPVAWQKRG